LPRPIVSRCAGRGRSLATAGPLITTFAASSTDLPLGRSLHAWLGGNPSRCPRRLREWSPSYLWPCLMPVRTGMHLTPPGLPIRGHAVVEVPKVAVAVVIWGFRSRQLPSSSMSAQSSGRSSSAQMEWDATQHMPFD
jgi:hypothetical protein